MASSGSTLVRKMDLSSWLLAVMVSSLYSAQVEGLYLVCHVYCSGCDTYGTLQRTTQEALIACII